MDVGSPGEPGHRPGRQGRQGVDHGPPVPDHRAGDDRDVEAQGVALAGVEVVLAPCHQHEGIGGVPPGQDELARCPQLGRAGRGGLVVGALGAREGVGGGPAHQPGVGRRRPRPPGPACRPTATAPSRAPSRAGRPGPALPRARTPAWPRARTTRSRPTTYAHAGTPAGVPRRPPRCGRRARPAPAAAPAGPSTHDDVGVRHGGCSCSGGALLVVGLAVSTVSSAVLGRRGPAWQGPDLPPRRRWGQLCTAPGPRTARRFAGRPGGRPVGDGLGKSGSAPGDERARPGDARGFCGEKIWISRTAIDLCLAGAQSVDSSGC